jgi:hypothetical protein
MPYISLQQRRDVQCITTDARTSGELNYEITTLIVSYLRRHGESYGVINDIVGALESAKAEFQRRVVAPYEDLKIKLNGDVYDTN